MHLRVGFVVAALFLLLARVRNGAGRLLSRKIVYGRVHPEHGAPREGAGVGRSTALASRNESHGSRFVRRSSPTALGLFVGPGSGGIAWAVPSPIGNFALSIRGRTEGCAVWARTANPLDVEMAFKRILEGVKRPGLEVRTDKDNVDPSPAGQVRSIVYNVRPVAAPTGYEFIMIAAENPGAAFQASMQVHPARAD